MIKNSLLVVFALFALFAFQAALCQSGLPATISPSGANLPPANSLLAAAPQQPPPVDTVTELFKAISSGREQDVRTMFVADPQLAFAKDKSGNSALLFALYRNQGPIARLIVGYRKNDLSIFEAAALGDDEKIQSLLSQNPALVDAFAPDGFSALHLASFFGHPSSEEALLSAGASVNTYSRNSLHATPLQSAAAARQVGAARTLLQHGANPNCKGEEEYTPLHEAAGNGQIEMIRLLIANGADLSAKGEDGKTPWDIAIQQKQPDEVLSLLKKEAN